MDFSHLDLITADQSLNIFKHTVFLLTPSHRLKSQPHPQAATLTETHEDPKTGGVLGTRHTKIKEQCDQLPWRSGCLHHLLPTSVLGTDCVYEWVCSGTVDKLMRPLGVQDCDDSHRPSERKTRITKPTQMCQTYTQRQEKVIQTYTQPNVTHMTEEP